MLSRRLQYSANSIIIVLIVLGIFAVVNFMSTRHFVRADLTEGKDFTISDSTRKTLGELDDMVNVVAYFSKNLPPYLTELERRIRDIFDEYRAYAHGNLSVKFIDPMSDPRCRRRRILSYRRRRHTRCRLLRPVLYTPRLYRDSALF